MSTAYATALFNSKVGSSSGHGLNRMSTPPARDLAHHLHLGDRRHRDRRLSAPPGHRDQCGAEGRGSAGQRRLARPHARRGRDGLGPAVQGRDLHGGPCRGRKRGHEQYPAGYLYQNTSGADLAVIDTVHAGAASPAAGTLELDVEYYVEDVTATNP